MHVAPAAGNAGSAETRFVPVTRCWVCDRTRLKPVYRTRFELQNYWSYDPELTEYTGLSFQLNRCRDCGFGQPDCLPTLPRFFDRLYDLRWPAEWIRTEFDSTYKDFIFATTLRELANRLAPERRTLLDVGAHVGRLLSLAVSAGWTADGIELNPITAAYAAERTQLRVERKSAEQLRAEGRRYWAVTLIDVLEHMPDPLPVLSNLAGLLEPGGWIAIKVPCGPGQLLKERLRARLQRGYKMQLIENLGHVSLFSAGSLRLALRKAGYTSIALTVGAPELLPEHDHAPFLTGSNRIRRGVYELARRLPGGIHTPLALNLQAYAQRAA